MTVAIIGMAFLRMRRPAQAREFENFPLGPWMICHTQKMEVRGEFVINLEFAGIAENLNLSYHLIPMCSDDEKRPSVQYIIELI